MLADLVRREMSRDGGALSAEFARLLAEAGWRRLASVGIGPENYSTLRAMNADPASPRHILSLLKVHDGQVMRVERLGPRIPRRYLELGMRESGLATDRLTAALASGLNALGEVPEALGTVASLARSVHCLAVDDPSTDISYSDPEVLFSIFIGIHEKPVPDEPLRIAEQILHETMHLQLSLAEDVVQLVTGAEERWHSPWRERPRPTQGVLHGLYVFHAIQDFLERYASRYVTGAPGYVARRLQTIALEIAEASAIAGSADLTDAGRVLVARLGRPRALPT